MNTEEKLKRLINPQSLRDYGITVSLKDILRDAPGMFQTHIAPFLPDILVNSIPDRPARESQT